MVHHFRRYMSGNSPVPFFYPVIPIQNFAQSRNPEGHFSTSLLPWCFQSRILPRFFLKSRIPCFKYGKFWIPKTYWGPCIRHYVAWNSFKSSKLRSFPENVDKFASTIIFQLIIYRKNLWKQVAIKWRGYWSEFSLCKFCSSSTLPRQQRRHYLRYLRHSFVVNMRLEAPASMCH